jgi:hypothetical protein
MTIYEIKERTQKTAPYYFDKKTLQFFGQTMRSFKVSKQEDGRYKISAPMKSYWDTPIGESVRFFNPLTNELELK